MGAGASSNITEGTAAITHDAKNVDSFDTGNVTEAKPARYICMLLGKYSILIQIFLVAPGKQCFLKLC